MSAAETLRRARELLTPEGAWGQGYDALNGAGEAVSPTAHNAVCRCSYGALRAAGGDVYGDAAREVLLQAIGLEAAKGDSVINWNDDPGRTHAEVLAAFDRAIELAQRDTDLLGVGPEDFATAEDMGLAPGYGPGRAVSP